MDNIKIKQLFLNIEIEKPFRSTDFFSFFKYNRHNHFIRYLDQPKFYKDLDLEHFCYKIKNCYGDTISINRKLFLFLCKKQKIDSKIYEDYYFEYKKNLINNQTSIFYTRKSGVNFSPKIYPTPKGKNYNHSLNTVNIAHAIDVCPYELFTFCSTKLEYKIDYVSLDISNKYGFGKKTPYYHFDSKYSNKRNAFLQLLIYLKEEYKLSELNKNLLDIYYDAVKEMLFKQIAIEHKKKFYAEKRKSRKEKGNLIRFTSKQMKTLYRKAAKLFHPDKKPNDLETFKKVNQYYRENNYSDLLKLVESK